MPVTHAIELLSDGVVAPLPATILVTGNERAWRLWALDQLRAACGADADHLVLPGETLELRTLRDELSTHSLFAMEQSRLIVVRDADGFVERHRQPLEALLESRGSTDGPPPSVCVLEANSVASNTRLYKAIAERGLVIDARLPLVGKSAKVDFQRLGGFVGGWLARRHGIQLEPAAVSVLLELTGTNLAAVDSALAKLALYAPPAGQRIGPPLVEQVVGGWRAKTIWQVIDAVADGDPGESLRQLDHLLASGEEPLGLLPQLAWALRRFGVATHLYQQAVDRGESPALAACLQRAGVKNFAGELAKCERQVRRMGRPRAARLLDWLLAADLKLKGSHSTDDRARWVLEELMLKIAVDDATRPAGRSRSREPS